MMHRRRVEYRLGAFDELREDRARAFVSERRERAQRFKLADRGDPAADVRAASPPPRFDRHGELGHPQQRRRRGLKNHVIARRIQVLHQPAKMPDLLRCGAPTGIERALDSTSAGVNGSRYDLEQQHQQFEFVAGWSPRSRAQQNREPPSVNAIASSFTIRSGVSGKTCANSSASAVTIAAASANAIARAPRKK